MIKTLLEDLIQPNTQTAELAPKLILTGLGLTVVGGLLYLLTNKPNQEFVNLVPGEKHRTKRPIVGAFN